MPDRPWPKEATPALLQPLCPYHGHPCHLACDITEATDCLTLFQQDKPLMPLAQFEAWKAERKAGAGKP